MTHFGSVIALHRIEMEGPTLHVLPFLYIQIYEWEAGTGGISTTGRNPV